MELLSVLEGRMSTTDRRDFLTKAALASASSTLAVGSSDWTLGALHSCSYRPLKRRKRELFVSAFRVRVTPPIGHSCCGGWIKPVEKITDDLEAIGVVLSGDFRPIVLCAVDWTGILNRTHLYWRKTIAEALDTEAHRVAVQCVHQHNAPFACLEAQELVSKYEDLPAICNSEYVVDCARRVAKAAAASLTRRQALTHLELGKVQVDRVASNRRRIDDSGKIVDWRGSSSQNPEHKRWPEGLIDPWLRTIAFCNADRRVAALHYYATHPMSYYGDGRVTSDFVGIARKRRQAAEPDCTHIYFTGCAGNIAAGKYNDGTPKARDELTQRMSQAINAAAGAVERVEVGQIEWRHRNVMPNPRKDLDETALLKQIADKTKRVVDRNRPAFQAAWLQRFKRRQPIVLSSLHMGPATVLHLPAESFIEYQFAAQESAPHRFVATAAYGDGGPWYIPTAAAYPQGGYEVRMAWCSSSIDRLLREGIQSLVAERVDE